SAPRLREPVAGVPRRQRDHRRGWTAAVARHGKTTGDSSESETADGDVALWVDAAASRILQPGLLARPDAVAQNERKQNCAADNGQEGDLRLHGLSFRVD